jgi:glycosyltransferase involved in cell wall biosynthesis
MTGSTQEEQRILHVGQFIDSMDPGGAESVVVNLARELPKYGIRVTVFHFGNPWLTEQIESAGLDGVVLSDRYYKSIVALPVFLSQFRTILKVYDVELLHTHLLGAIFAGSVAARMAGIPSIGTIHDVYSLKESGMNVRYLRWAQKAGCQLVAVCDAMREEIENYCGLRRMKRIYNGIDIDLYDARSESTTSSEVVRIIAVARAVPIKRLDVLLNAVASLDPGSPFELVIVGDGPLLRDLRHEADKLGVASSVLFLGHRDDVSRLLSESDIYTQVSDSEGLSISVLESMAAGLPAVVTDVGGNKELVSDGTTGFIVPSGDVKAVSRQLSNLIEDSGKRRAFGRAARAKVKQTFAIGTMCQSYAEAMRVVSEQHA